MKNTLGELKVALKKVDFDVKNLDVGIFVKMRITLEELKLQLKAITEHI